MPKNKVKRTPVDADVWREIREKEQECIAFLKLDAADAPESIVKKIDEFVDELLESSISNEEMEKYTLMLGVMWGSMIIKKYGWEWQMLDLNDGNGSQIFLVSPKSYYCCPAIYYINNILDGGNIGPWGGNDNTIMLLFNMLANIEKKKPKSKYEVVV